MREYLIRRLLLAIPTLFIVSLIVFFMIRLIPGDIVDVIITEAAAQGGGGSQDVEVTRARVESQLGLDVPILTQYFRWLGIAPGPDGSFSGILQGDLGDSLRSGESVTSLMAPRWPVTLELALLSIVLSYLISIPLGIISAVRQETLIDYIVRSTAILWLAVPAFWVGTMVMVFPALWWGWSPPIFVIPFNEDPVGHVGMFILPALIMALAVIGGMMRSTRTWMLEVIRQDYIRTAWSKGLRERTVLVRHAFRNTLIPIVTGIGLRLPILIGGAVIIENIFQLPGLGQLSLTAIETRDYTIVSGMLVITSAVVVFGNVIVDILYGFVDPRIRYN